MPDFQNVRARNRPVPQESVFRGRAGVARQQGPPPVSLEEQDERLVVGRVQFPARTARVQDFQAGVAPTKRFTGGE
jgi:hypothetical protein